MKLSILCVTKGEPHAWALLDDMIAVRRILGVELVVAMDVVGLDEVLDPSVVTEARFVPVKSAGYIESVLDEALSHCSGDYVLRLDDDERCSPAMVEWLKSGAWQSQPHWKFPRMNLWGDADHFLVTPHLWPDHQTRLSLRSLAGGRTSIHAGSPHGGGEVAPCAILHHKFLVKPLAERREIVARYESIQQGAGFHFRPFSIPEEVYREVGIAEVGDGSGREIIVRHERWAA